MLCRCPVASSSARQITDCSLLKARILRASRVSSRTVAATNTINPTMNVDAASNEGEHDRYSSTGMLEPLLLMCVPVVVTHVCGLNKPVRTATTAGKTRAATSITTGGVIGCDERENLAVRLIRLTIPRSSAQRCSPGTPLSQPLY